MEKEINKFQSLEEFKQKFEEIKVKHNFVVEEIPWTKFDQWEFKNMYKTLEHTSGKFFKIEGLRIKANDGIVKEWDQPIINQPEIGILGIMSKVFDGTRYYLMQAKMEPGNINILQLSPTIQATKSNFLQVHKGNRPDYLEYFMPNDKSEVLIDLLLSEQGGKFIKKRNRNVVIEVFEDVEVLDGFFWLTLTDIKELLKIDNFVNMDARSVISTIPILELEDNGVNSVKELLSWINDKKVWYELEVEKIPLKDMRNWGITENNIYNKLNPFRYFSVIGVNVKAGTREVKSWTQPMVKDENIGLIGFIRKNIDGIPHYLVQTKIMPGNIDVVDISPTVSISNFLYVIGEENKPLFLDYFIKSSDNVNVIFEAFQSEEGGRFYHYQNLNMIVEIEEEIKFPDSYKWMTYEQLILFMNMGYINIECRSLISTIQ